VARPYGLVRDHLDDLIELARLVFARRRGDLEAAPPAVLAQRELEIVDLGERLEDRLAASFEAGGELPFDRLRTAFQLTATEQRCLELAIALAVSGEVRELAGRPTGTCSLELLDELVYAHASVRDRFADELAPDGRLLGYGLLEPAGAADGRGESRFVRPLRVADRIVDLVYGGERASAELAGFAELTAPAAQDLLIAPADLALARRTLERHVATGGGPLLVVRGGPGSGRRSLIGAVARELRARVLTVRTTDLPLDRLGHAVRAVQREAILARAVIALIDGDEPTAGDEAHRARAAAIAAAFAGYPGPIALTVGLGGDAAPYAGARGATTLELPVLSEAQRTELWSRHVDRELAAEAALRYRLTGGQIERAAEHARARGDRLDLAAIHAGVRAVLDGQMSALGVRLDWSQDWRDLVVPDDSREELGELIDRVMFRRKVIDDWGFGAKVAKGLGVAALFYGPPGTGKTMAAGLIARALGLDLYQIDVSRLVSKYIGETEKNLAREFEAADAGHAVLLFDEADSLFAKRTEVKSSVDRYANLEVNYLLQRMESFDGITILTTNFETSLDEAFRRRLAYRIQFPVPELDERARLWQSVIPPQALGNDVDFDLLAERFEMTGGYIKNAAMRAAFIAAAERGRIYMRHLLRAASAEYASLGKVMTQRVTRGS